MTDVFKLIEANGLTLHGDIEHFAALVRADERDRVKEALAQPEQEPDDLTIDILQLWDCMGYKFTIVEKIGLRNLGVKFLGKDKQWHFGRYMFTVDFCADEMALDTGFTEQAEEHKSFNWIALDNGQFACQPNNRCLWYDQSLIPTEVKFPDFQAAKDFYTVDGTRKWSAGDDWFYDIQEKNT